MRINRIKKILRDYRLGRSSYKENQIIDQWYASLNNKQQEVNKEEINKRGHNMLVEINKRIDAKEKAASVTRDLEKGAPIDFNYVLKIAAVFLLGIIMVSILVYNKSGIGDQQNQSFEINVSEIHLPDGSTVWLKSDSELVYPDKFESNRREVYLEGEAFFDVVRDKERPFVIYSKDMVTSVLGTSFNVKDYKKDSEKAVEVLTGSVKVSLNLESGEEEQVILKSREKINFDKAKSKGAVVLKKDTKDYPPEIIEELKFTEAPIQDILEKLGKVHGVDIRMKNSGLNKCRLTTDLSYEKLDVCLEIISRALNAKYYQIEDQIYIDGKGC